MTQNNTKITQNNLQKYITFNVFLVPLIQQHTFLSLFLKQDKRFLIFLLFIDTHRMFEVIFKPTWKNIL